MKTNTATRFEPENFLPGSAAGGAGASVTAGTAPGSPDQAFTLIKTELVRPHASPAGKKPRNGAKAVAGLLAGACAAGLLFALIGTAGAAPLAWMFGWVYLVWALDTPRVPAALVDGALALLTLVAGFLAAGHPAGLIWLFVAHAAVWPLRALVGGRDARMPLVAAMWISFHAVMALLLV